MLLSILWQYLITRMNEKPIGWNVARQSFEHAIAIVNKDATLSELITGGYEIAGTAEADTTISPDPTAHDQECILLLAERFLVKIDVVSASDYLSWKSGDKSVDRSQQTISKRALLQTLWDEYRRLTGIDDATLVTGGAYESVGSDIEEDENKWEKIE